MYFLLYTSSLFQHQKMFQNIIRNFGLTGILKMYFDSVKHQKLFIELPFTIQKRESNLEFLFQLQKSLNGE